jgi:hypothetical protein
MVAPINATTLRCRENSRISSHLSPLKDPVQQHAASADVAPQHDAMAAWLL